MTGYFIRDGVLNDCDAVVPVHNLIFVVVDDGGDINDDDYILGDVDDEIVLDCSVSLISGVFIQPLVPPFLPF